MKIDLKKLGLTSESTFDEIQKALTGLELFDAHEVKEKSDAAAAGARKAALAQASKEKNILSEEEMKEYQTFKKDQKTSKLQDNDIIKKFGKEDQDLIIRAEKLLDLDGEELDSALAEVSKKYAKRMTSKIPPKIDDADKEEKENDLDNYRDL